MHRLRGSPLLVISRKMLSSTSSKSSNESSIYETAKVVNEYVQFHYGSSHDILPYPQGPTEALSFLSRIANTTSKHLAPKQRRRVLDVGCAVGGLSFLLAKEFDEVVGIDYSQQFINKANEMKEHGKLVYDSILEGELKIQCNASLPNDIERNRVNFKQGDACNLPENLGQFDAVIASNLLCRLPDPSLFLKRVSSLVSTDGILFLISPYSWLEQYTPKEKWLGGFAHQNNTISSYNRLCELLSPHFTLVERSDLPFLIREHARKYQWGISEGLVWKKMITKT